MNVWIQSINNLWFGWGAESRIARWYHYGCATQSLLQTLWHRLNWTTKLSKVPSCISSFKSLVLRLEEVYCSDSPGLIPEHRVCAEKVALPEAIEKILPIVELLPAYSKDRYITEDDIVIYDGRAWEEAKKNKEDVRMINGLKCVEKADCRQRLIFDSRPVNLVLTEPPHVELPNFGLLEDWFLGENEVARFGKIDLDNYYHRLRVPCWIMAFLGLPPIQAMEVGKEGHVVYPVCTTLPIGLSHSVILAQSVHLELLKNVPLAKYINRPPSPKSEIWVLVYIDDIIISGKARSADEAAHEVNNQLQELVCCYETAGMVVNKMKVIYATPELEGLGCVILNGERVITPIPARFLQICAATQAFVQCQQVERKWVERLLGHWV